MRVFEKILCPVDFSEGSVKALQWTEHLAARFQSKVTALYVNVAEFGANSDPFIYDYDPTLSMKRAEERMKDFVAPLKIKPETIVCGGSPAEEIERIATRMEATIIVMATHGRKGITHKLLGSTTEDVIRRMTVPVFTVSPKSTFDRWNDNKGVLVPLNITSEPPSCAVRMKQVVKELTVPLTLMHVVDYHDDMFGVNFQASPFNVTAYETSRMEHELLRIARLLNGEDTEAMIKFGNAAEEILREAALMRYSYLLLGVKKEKAFTRFFESSAYKVISQSPVPVITLKMLS